MLTIDDIFQHWRFDLFLGLVQTFCWFVFILSILMGIHDLRFFIIILAFLITIVSVLVDRVPATTVFRSTVCPDRGEMLGLGMHKAPDKC